MAVSIADMRESKVTLDGQTSPIRALLTDYRWNGWECPYFYAGDIRAHRAEFDALYADVDADAETNTVRYWWDDVADLPSIVDVFDDGTEENAVHVVTTSEDVELVTVGWGFFVWSEATDWTTDYANEDN